MEQLRKNLVKHDFSFTSYTKWSAHFKNKWIESFASHLTEQEQHSIYLRPTKSFCGYLWHLFSYNKRPALEGTAAIAAFEQLEKKKIIIFHQMYDEIFMIEDGSNFTVNLLPADDDYYVVDENFTWSFNTTHEQPHIGPFFTQQTV